MGPHIEHHWGVDGGHLPTGIMNCRSKQTVSGHTGASCAPRWWWWLFAGSGAGVGDDDCTMEVKNDEALNMG